MQTINNGESGLSVRNKINENFSISLENKENGADITLGAELLDSNGWTSVGWTGDFETGFTHIVGQAPALIRALGNTGTKKYLVEFDVESPTNTGSPDASVAFTVKIGNSPAFAVYRSTGNQHFAIGITSVSDGNLEFLPCNPASLSSTGSAGDTYFNGTIKNISLKEITAAGTTNISLKDKSGEVSFDMRQTGVSLFNSFFGKSAGIYNQNGDGNTGIGYEALKNNVWGFWNTGIGKQALSQNTTGSRNVGIGVYALKDLISGNRNLAIGTFAMEKLKDGINNIAIGADAFQYASTGVDNISIGLAALGGSLTLANGNIAIGKSAAGVTTSGDHIIAIGESACSKTTGYANIGIGRYALQNNTSGYENIAIGIWALKNNVTGLRNVAIGSQAGYGADGFSFSYCVFIGRNAGYSNKASDQVFVGYDAGAAVTTGAKNTFIGNKAGNNVTTGFRNIIIGNEVYAPTAETADYLNIGNLITGNLQDGSKKVSVSGSFAATLPEYLDNSAALSGGLIAGDFYKTATGEVRIVI